MIGPLFSKGGRMIRISRGIWSKFGCMNHKSIKWRGHPLPSMVFDNPWFCSMVCLQGKLYLSHPLYLTTHGFRPWYGPKEHCNNVIKRPYAFSIKDSRIFGILHYLTLLNYWVFGFELTSTKWGISYYVTKNSSHHRFFKWFTTKYEQFWLTQL